jgi:hypothetical protein
MGITLEKIHFKKSVKRLGTHLGIEALMRTVATPWLYLI